MARLSLIRDCNAIGERREGRSLPTTHAARSSCGAELSGQRLQPIAVGGLLRRTMALRPQVLLGAALLAVLRQQPLCHGQHVVGPGGVTPYSGGGARRSGGWGYVRDPAEGFFVAGSSIKEMNGVYKRVEKVPSAIPHTFHYAYRKWPYGSEDDMRSWHMALVKSPGPDDGYEAVGSHESEWLFIDSDHRDRFGHEGATVIPGSGTDWAASPLDHSLS